MAGRRERLHGEENYGSAAKASPAPRWAKSGAVRHAIAGAAAEAGWRAAAYVITTAACVAKDELFRRRDGRGVLA
jgi:hypothetical protein